MFNYSDDAEVVGTGGSSLKFGLNQKAKFLGIRYLQDCRKEEKIAEGGEPVEAIDLIFMVGETEISNRLLPVTKAYDAKGNESNDVKLIEAERKLQVAYINHFVSIFVKKEDIQQAFIKYKPSNYKALADMYINIMPKDYAEKDIDLFLQYGWKMAEGADKTYLQVPKPSTLKHGIIACEHVVGKFKELRKQNPSDTDEKALQYIGEDAKTIHPFIRTGWFVNSNYAKQQKSASTSTGKGNTSSLPSVDDNFDPNAVWEEAN